MTRFKLHSEFRPRGDQPNAINDIAESVGKGNKHQLLKGVTGSGKTFTIAHAISQLNMPSLVIAPNKTLAAQLFSELKDLFPENKVGFFISYYDYYQPEAYIPGSDTYIAKDSSINDDIDKMRHEATQNLFERQDTIIVASVSCIYGLGSPEAYANQLVSLETGMELDRNQLLRKLIDIQYTRNDTSLLRGTFRVRGDTVDILPSHQSDEAIRVEFFGDEIDRMSIIDTLSGKEKQVIAALSIYPNSHYITERNNMAGIIKQILTDLGIRLRELREQEKHVEYQRLEQRTMHDVELLEQLGFCPGIENYSRYLTGLSAGSPPPTRLDYFPENFLTVIDESHITIPQIGGMYRGDRARKENLVNYGFRLPAALDNRPLNFDEFLGKTSYLLHVTATPSDYDFKMCSPRIFEQVIRPTGLVDPSIEVRKSTNQIDDLLAEIRHTTKKGFRTLITTLTKRMAEDITKYYEELGLNIRYLHSDIDSLERSEILRDLRKGVFDVLVGINLLREGLDLPEVALVGILDADKQGFLRSKSSLIQTVGRAARNSEGRVIFYGDKITEAMEACINETERRRSIQLKFNKENNISPKTIEKELPKGIREIYGLETPTGKQDKETSSGNFDNLSETAIEKLIKTKTKAMKKAAADLDFEHAAELRDIVKELKNKLIIFGGDSDGSS